METAVANTSSTGRRTGAGLALVRDAGRRLLTFTRSTTFGNVVIVLFFVSQALDGGLTYIGVQTYGSSIEGNPLLAWLMTSVGEGPALATAKLAAVGFGMVLHLASVHRALALLTALYMSAAVVPWMLVLVLAGHIR
jgi:uncharacterized membrane protein